MSSYIELLLQLIRIIRSRMRAVLLSMRGVKKCQQGFNWSTDGTAGYLSKLARADPRVRVIHQTNQGLTSALVNGCQVVREFIGR